MSRASIVAGFEAGARGRPEAVDRSGSEVETLTLLSRRLETWLRKDILIGSKVWNCSWSGSGDKGLEFLSFGEVAETHYWRWSHFSAPIRTPDYADSHLRLGWSVI